jgi:nucleotide-binding universal stress UspA family protein
VLLFVFCLFGMSGHKFLWAQMLSNAPGSFYVRLGVESCVGKEQASVLDVAKTNQHIKDKAMHELAAVVKQAKETKKGENIQGWLLTGDKSIKDLALDFAVRHKIDHIFIGDHDKSLRALGSFADYVVMHAGCDVTVVKHR